MRRLCAGFVAVVLSCVASGCGDNGESDQLRAELSTLQTQVAQPTATASPTTPPTATTVPTTAGTPTQTADEKKQLIAAVEVEKIRMLVSGAQDQAKALQWANQYNPREKFIDLLDDFCADVPRTGYSGSIRVGGYDYSVGALWPEPYLKLDSAVLGVCENYLSTAYSVLGSRSYDFVIGYAQGERTKILNLLEALPTYSEGQLERIIIDRQ